jgi:hypothetical protein
MNAETCVKTVVEVRSRHMGHNPSKNSDQYPVIDYERDCASRSTARPDQDTRIWLECLIEQ